MENRDQATNAINEAAKGNRTIPSQYHIRNQVWLEGKNLKFPHQATKLNPKCYGPFKIIKEISPVVYQLQLPPSWNIHPMFHASLLSSYSETPSHSPNFSRPPPDLIDNEEEYEVEQIKAHWNFSTSKCLQYLIKWKGYPESDNTWEDATDIHAPNLTKQYHKRHPLQKIKGRLLSLLHSSPFPLHTLTTTILNQPQSLFPYPCYHPSMRSPLTIHHQQSSSDLCSAYTCGRPTSSTSSTLVGSTTTPPSNIPSFTGTTVRRSAASTTTNRSAWPQPFSFPQPLVQPTQMSCTLSPSPLLTPYPLQSSTSPSSISTYEHTPNLAYPSKCLQMALSIPPTPCPSKTVSLSRFIRSRVRNHLCLPVPLQPPWRPTLTSTPTYSEPLQRGLLATITWHNAQEASEIRHLNEQIRRLHNDVEHYENIFERAPDGYIENDGQVPHFYIPLSDGVFKPAKWMKKLEDGKVARFHEQQGPNESPYVINLYAQADMVGHGKENPIKLLPAWFRTLLIGPSSDFVHLQCNISDLDDWGLAMEITRFCELDQEATKLAAQVDVLHEELNATRDARTMSEKRLVLARASQKVAQLENLPKKVSMLSTYSCCKNDNRRGRLI